jgi:endonuclease/exonuclease/phosphatase family metal-dependent hydrolase
MLPGRKTYEQRGALWVQVRADGRRLNVLTTHLGLSAAERRAQTEELVGPGWLGHPACQAPLALCGDLNTVPLFGVYRRFAEKLSDASNSVGWGRGRTYPSRFPFMRLDHVFVSPDIVVEQVSVPKTRLTTAASDHLPLIAVLTIP